MTKQLFETGISQCQNKYRSNIMLCSRIWIVHDCSQNNIEAQHCGSCSSDLSGSQHFTSVKWVLKQDPKEVNFFFKLKPPCLYLDSWVPLTSPKFEISWVNLFLLSYHMLPQSNMQLKQYLTNRVLRIFSMHSPISQEHFESNIQ